MQVTILPNARRPDVGKPPARENRRAWLPQQARFCPVLEDASKSGLLVYPPLAVHEALQVRYLESNAFRLTFSVDDPQGLARNVFVADIQPSAGGGGMDAIDVRFLEPAARLDNDAVHALIDALVTNVNTPPGGIGLRGAHDFVTPEGWDTLYLGVLNEVQRPQVPTLAVRVESDWYAQPTEFRYVLQAGDVLSASGAAPVGQVIFVPREELEVVEGTDADRQRFLDAQQHYWQERRSKERLTNFGALYSYHYRDEQKAMRAEQD